MSSLYRLKSDHNVIVVAQQLLAGVVYPYPEGIVLGKIDRIRGAVVYLSCSGTGLEPKPGDWIVGIEYYSQRAPYSPEVFCFLFEKLPNEAS